MAVPESVVETEGFCGQPRTEDSLSVAFRHAAGDLMVRIWEQECGNDSVSDIAVAIQLSRFEPVSNPFAGLRFSGANCIRRPGFSAFAADRRAE
jgi:hypothetical protein